jgi:hypothetical protein
MQFYQGGDVVAHAVVATHSLAAAAQPARLIE